MNLKDTNQFLAKIKESCPDKNIAGKTVFFIPETIKDDPILTMSGIIENTRYKIPLSDYDFNPFQKGLLLEGYDLEEENFS